MRKIMLSVSAALALLPLTAGARGRVAVFARPAYFPAAWYGYGPLYGPYPYGPYAGAPAAGEVKLDTKMKEAQVFVNGAYAGTAGKLKTMWMRPGSYTIEVRAAGYAPFSEKVYVVAGKTVHVEPGLPPEARP